MDSGIGVGILYATAMLLGYLFGVLGGLLLILRGILYERQQTQVLQQ